jgi:hypothetical protein
VLARKLLTGQSCVPRQVMTVMPRVLYTEPRGAYLPSILYLSVFELRFRKGDCGHACRHGARPWYG